MRIKKDSKTDYQLKKTAKRNSPIGDVYADYTKNRKAYVKGSNWPTGKANVKRARFYSKHS